MTEMAASAAASAAEPVSTNREHVPAPYGVARVPADLGATRARPLLWPARPVATLLSNYRLRVWCRRRIPRVGSSRSRRSRTVQHGASQQGLFVGYRRSGC